MNAIKHLTTALFAASMVVFVVVRGWWFNLKNNLYNE